MFTALDGDPEDTEALSVSKVMQWLSCHAHRHLLLSERQASKNHCSIWPYMHGTNARPQICYPVVSACTKAVTFPTAHLTSLNELKENMKIAVKQRAYFYWV